mgnify:CR=1 FL=1
MSTIASVPGLGIAPALTEIQIASANGTLAKSVVFTLTGSMSPIKYVNLTRLSLNYTQGTGFVSLAGRRS